MHIVEGFLPTPWWQAWFALSIPMIVYGMYKINRLVNQKREIMPLLAAAGAFIFGPATTTVLLVIALIFQALFLACGGLTTLGAAKIYFYFSEVKRDIRVEMKVLEDSIIRELRGLPV